MATEITTERQVVMRDGQQQYRIVTLCTDAGRLPDTGVFLMEITESGDATKDEFVRIVSIIDFTEYSAHRSAALAAGSTYWRNYAFTRYFTDVDVGVSAATAIKDRLNELTTDYATYDDSFITPAPPDNTYSLPSADATYIDTLKDTYDTQYTAYQTAVTDKATAQADKNDADSELETASDSYDDLNQTSEEMSKICTNFASAVGAMTTFSSPSSSLDTLVRVVKEKYAAADDTQALNTLTELVTALDELTEYHAGYSSDRESYNTSSTEGGVNSAACSTYRASFDSTVLSDAEQRRQTAQTDVTEKSTALAEAEAAVTTAYANLETAYDDVKEVCPDWSPTDAFPPVS